jgi:hypothetical protein
MISTKQCVGGRRGSDRMVVGFTITCAINAYGNWSTRRKPPTCRKSLTLRTPCLSGIQTHLAMNGVQTHNVSGDRH